MFLSQVNNIEYNKENIYTGMEVISLTLLYLHDIAYKNSKNENVLINNISHL